jgi:hypothetical protein
LSLRPELGSAEDKAECADRVRLRRGRRALGRLFVVAEGGEIIGEGPEGRGGIE